MSLAKNIASVMPLGRPVLLGEVCDRMKRAGLPPPKTEDVRAKLMKMNKAGFVEKRQISSGSVRTTYEWVLVSDPETVRSWDLRTTAKDRKKFALEGDVVKLVKRAIDLAKGGVFRIEAGLGGTTGFPDCVAVRDGRVMFLELKLGRMGTEGLVVEARNSQRIVLRKIAALGGTCGVVVGEENGRRIWLGRGDCLRPKPSRSVDSSKVRGSCLHFVEAPEEVWFDDEMGFEFLFPENGTFGRRGEK